MTDSQPLGRREILMTLLLLVLLALVARLPMVSDAPMMDELYHHFAAQSWLAEGELGIADGIYTRASGYTKLVAFAYGLFGEHIEVLRMIGVIAAVLTVVALFFWTRVTAGAIAAWIAAVFFCFWPDGIDVSVTNRFYAPHGLLFFLGAVCVYLPVEKWDWWGARHADRDRNRRRRPVRPGARFAEDHADRHRRRRPLGLDRGRPALVRQARQRPALADACRGRRARPRGARSAGDQRDRRRLARGVPLDAGLGGSDQEPVLVLPRAAHALLPDPLVAHRHRRADRHGLAPAGRSAFASRSSSPPSSCSRSAA